MNTDDPSLSNTVGIGYLRVAYVCEFWLVLLCIHVAWPQAGGQAHLDIMGWHWKLLLPLLLSASVVGLTAAAVSGEVFWYFRSIVWLLVALVLALAMGLVTYYYHLHENDNLEDGSPTETAAFSRGKVDLRDQVSSIRDVGP